jgi:polysaccharide transporter, PST family
MIKRSGIRLIENIFSMVTLRAAEYILSFLMVPFLLRMLGPSQYGAIAFMQGLAGYFHLCIHYGFNMTAPRDLAQADEKEIPRIFSTYIWATCMLFAVVTAVGVPLYAFLGRYFSAGVDWPLFLAVYTSVVATVVFPVWYFQGIQEMRYITILNLTGRLCGVLGVFVFVRSPADYVLAAFLLCSPGMFAGIVSWWIIHCKSPGVLRPPVWSDMKRAYRDGKEIFLSTLAINLYTTSDVVILGFLTNATVVGYYGGADKFVNCIKRAVGAVNDAVYPYISRVLAENRERGFYFLRRQLLVYTVCGFLGGAALYALSPWGVPWLLGERYIPSIAPLQVMAFVPLVVAMSNVLGYETMLPLGMETIFSRVLVIAAIFNLIIIWPLILWNGAVGTAWAILATETLVAVMMGAVLWKRRILIRK